MTSIIYFKFRAMKAYESLMFDGHFLSARELKQLIADKRGLVGGAAGDLVLSEPPDGPEFTDDAQIPKGKGGKPRELTEDCARSSTRKRSTCGLLAFNKLRG